MSLSLIRLACFCAVMGMWTACSSGPRAVRGADEPGLDYHAMSTGLDRKDLQQLAQDNLKALRGSAIVQEWSKQTDPALRPGLGVMPIDNETSEHIGGALSALASDVETELVNWGAVRVVSVKDQQQLIADMRMQAGGGEFKQGQYAQLGNLIGAKYLITSKITTADERIEDQRRVQYFMFMRVLAVESGEILFQNKSEITKAMIR